MNAIHSVIAGASITVYAVMLLCAFAVWVWRMMRVSGIFRLPKSTIVVLLISIFCATIQAQKPRTCYVDALAEEGGDGSEGRPFRDIQLAVDSFSLQTNRFDVAVMPGVYGSVRISGLSVTISSTTNDGERVIDGNGGNWAVFSDVAPENGNSLTGFYVKNAENGVAGFTVHQCDVSDCVQIGVSNCVVKSSIVRGPELGVVNSVLWDVDIINCGVGVWRGAMTNCAVTGCTELGVGDSQIGLSYITNNFCCAVSNSVVDTCLIAENEIGLIDGFISGSTVAANRLGGVSGKVTACNTVLAYNKDGNGRYENFSGEEMSMTNCCTSPMPSKGTDNIVCGLPIHPRTYLLRPSSPAIGSGSTNLVLSSRDLAGRQRVYNGAVDIGAFRFQCSRLADCTRGSPIPVPYEWLKEKLYASYNDVKGKGKITAWEDNGSYVRFNYDRYYGGILHKSEYAYITCETMAMYTSDKKLPDGEAITWWQEYLVGTDPNSGDDYFTAGIVVTNGIPYISWSPDLGGERLYLIMGTRNLDEEWELVDDVKSTDCDFFKVGVDFP